MRRHSQFEVCGTTYAQHIAHTLTHLPQRKGCGRYRQRQHSRVWSVSKSACRGVSFWIEKLTDGSSNTCNLRVVEQPHEALINHDSRCTLKIAHLSSLLWCSPFTLLITRTVCNLTKAPQLSDLSAAHSPPQLTGLTLTTHSLSHILSHSAIALVH